MIINLVFFTRCHGMEAKRQCDLARKLFLAETALENALWKAAVLDLHSGTGVDEAMRNLRPLETTYLNSSGEIVTVFKSPQEYLTTPNINTIIKGQIARDTQKISTLDHDDLVRWKKQKMTTFSHRFADNMARFATCMLAKKNRITTLKLSKDSIAERTIIAKEIEKLRIRMKQEAEIVTLLQKVLASS